MKATRRTDMQNKHTNTRNVHKQSTQALMLALPPFLQNQSSREANGRINLLLKVSSKSPSPTQEKKGLQ